MLFLLYYWLWPVEPEPVVRDESEFVCEQCKQPFESKAELDAHINSNSQEHPCAIPLHPRWYCNFSTCTVSYVSYRRLQAHYREAHTTLVDTACVRCNRAFPTLQHLQQHHQSNPRCDIATFRCTVGECQLQLDDSVAMQAHVMYHIDNGDALGDVLAHHNQWTLTLQCIMSLLLFSVAACIINIFYLARLITSK